MEMAKKVTVPFVDDLDGTAAADETVAFTLDGVAYEIDLSTKNWGMTIRQRRYLMLYSTVGQCISRSPALSRRSVDHRMIDHALLNTPHRGNGAVFTGLHQMLERLTQRFR
jgi:Lsr2